MKNEKEFTTRDIYLASTLISLRFYMLRIDYQIEGTNHRPVGYFSFEETPELIKTERDYWNGKLAVEPQSFVTILKGLRSQTNTTYKSPHSTFQKKSG